MKVFIDANILLDLYRFSEADLKELEKLCQFVNDGKLDLLISTQIKDEFYRNRERVIADGLKQFKNSKVEIHAPNIIKSYPQYCDLENSANNARKALKTLEDCVNRDIENGSLPADKIIERLFSVITVETVSEEVHQRAIRRCEVGNPPGKRGSIGDAINWEWMLDRSLSSQQENIILLSSDQDFQSELNSRTLRQFLSKEWSRTHDCEIILKTSLASFLVQFIPQIELIDELAKEEAIEQLENSQSFTTTHRVISFLEKYEEFTEEEVERMVRACIENGQISLILGDLDVKRFVNRIVLMPCGNKKLKSVLEDALANFDESTNNDFRF